MGDTMFFVQYTIRAMFFTCTAAQVVIVLSGLASLAS
jgi:hypothetical protein